MTTTSAPSFATRPRVLFVGHDDGSPQIAAGLLHRLAGDQVAVYTADTQPVEPGGRSDEMLVAMGLNPADGHRLSAGALHRADRVVILGTGHDVARLPGPRYEEWDLAHDDLDKRIQRLSDQLTGVPARRTRPVRDRVWALVESLRRR